jgi:hypothetical protein
MPVQYIAIPSWVQGLWEQVQQGPVKMSEGCAKAAADVKFLMENCLVDYEDGFLKLQKDCKDSPVSV